MKRQSRGTNGWDLQATTQEQVLQEESSDGYKESSSWEMELEYKLQHQKSRTEITKLFLKFQHQRIHKTEESLQTKFKNMKAKGDV